MSEDDKAVPKDKDLFEPSFDWIKRGDKLYKEQLAKKEAAAKSKADRVNASAEAARKAINKQWSGGSF